MLALLIGCGLRRGELLEVACRLHPIARGSLGHCRPSGQGRAHSYGSGPKLGDGCAIDEWKQANGVAEGVFFRSIHRAGRVWGAGMTSKVLWLIVREAASRAGIEKLAPHDLRPHLCEALPSRRRGIGSNSVTARTCLDPNHRAFLGCKQNLRCAVSDQIGIEPEAQSS